MSHTKNRSSPYREFHIAIVTGALYGACHPFDNLKTTLQLDPSYRGLSTTTAARKTCAIVRMDNVDKTIEKNSNGDSKSAPEKTTTKSLKKREPEPAPKVIVTPSHKNTYTVRSELEDLINSIDPDIGAGIRHVPTIYLGSNEADGDGVEVFVVEAPKNIDNDDDMKAALYYGWSGEEGMDEYFISHDAIDASDIRSWFNSDMEGYYEGDYDMADTENADVCKALVLIERVKKAPKKFAAVLNGSGGKVFKFAVCTGHCVYRVGVGCVTSDGYLVGWQENNIVWT
mmetsp:Transcript_1690/g.1794  ORF Transcript_1690/g.1794 Transcript_1690/m.1794 type:complete len:285 (+) Transcript_1690:31-885(+)